MGNKPLAKQQEAYYFLKDSHTKTVAFGGGAGGGKSWLGCEWLLLSAYYLPGSRWFIGRNNLTDTRQSVAITWGKVCKAHGFTGYKVNNDGIQVTSHTGEVSEVIFLDLSFYPYKDPLFERLGSKEFTGGWIEEAGEVHQLAYDVLKTRVGRHLNREYGIIPKILITFNPKKNWLYSDIYKPWREGKLTKDVAFVQALVTDNKYQTPEYIENLQNIKDKATRERLLFGNWEYDDDPDALIAYDAIIDAFNNNHVAATSPRYITADIAMQGSDYFRVGVWCGFVLVDHASMAKSGGAEILQTIEKLLRKHQVRPGNIVYDSDGVGAFLGGQGGFISNAKPFNNGARPIGDDDKNYQNLKTQCYYYLAEKINAGELWLKSITSETDKEQIIAELEQVKSYNSDKDGRLQILPKDQVKQHIGRSPDWADMLMMRMFMELPHRKLPGML